MSNVEILNARPDVRGGYKVDVGRGERTGCVSSEWFSRPRQHDRAKARMTECQLHATKIVLNVVSS